MEKWISALAPEENMGTDAVAHDNSNGPGKVGTNASNQKKKEMKQIPGKYTVKKMDTASMVGGAILELRGSTNCTVLFRKTERVRSWVKWNMLS
jgi:hypothetical protein